MLTRRLFLSVSPNRCLDDYAYVSIERRVKVNDFGNLSLTRLCRDLDRLTTKFTSEDASVFRFPGTRFLDCNRTLNPDISLGVEYRILTAASGNDALRLFAEWPTVEVDLALIDLRMPEMEETETWRTHPRVASQSAAVLSRYPAEEMLRPTLARGFLIWRSRSRRYNSQSKIREVLDAPKADAKNA